MIPLRDNNPTRTFPIVTILLIAANVGIFLYQIMLPDPQERQFVMQFGMIPNRLGQELGSSSAPLLGVTTIFTSMFLHGGFMHILGNMWFLWVFGDNIEDRLGRVRYLVFYLLCGVGAALAHFLTDPRSAIPTVGASGAISGVLGAYLLLFPGRKVLTLIPLVVFWLTAELPAVVVLGLWFAFQFFQGFASLNGPGGPGVAWWAHIGGFVLGLILVRAFEPRRRIIRPS